MVHKNLYVNIHILQDVPPANLNRDDSGSPKSARYGGVDRLRVSSQAWKRATRKKFSEYLSENELGIRTRRVLATVDAALADAGVDEENARLIAPELLAKIGIKPGKKETDTAYLFFFSRRALPRLAARVVEEIADGNTDPKAIAAVIDVKEILGRGHSLDVALFGRMVADLPDINVDAACQVAHALATHSSATQFDYFTAVDDVQEGAEPGAGMIGTVEFNSATLYRYATISVPALIANMDETQPAIDGIAQFLRAFTMSMPSGKQNTFAAHTRPGLVLVEVRADQPVSYMSAFERPVRSEGSGFLSASIGALGAFIDLERVRWGDEPLATFSSVMKGFDDVEAFGRRSTFDDLVDSVIETVEGELANE